MMNYFDQVKILLVQTLQLGARRRQQSTPSTLCITISQKAG
jgi:hypothetical protein